MPGIHVFAAGKTWMAGTSPAMTAHVKKLYGGHAARRLARRVVMAAARHSARTAVPITAIG
jgi:hypothetical protein